jgi:hypothetical protein
MGRMEVLTQTEQASLAECESVIARGLRDFVEVGNALLTIRDSRPPLYRATHATFEDYCQERWDLGTSHSYRLIDSSQIVGHLSPIGDNLPSTESQARPLTTLRKQDDDGNRVIDLETVEEVWRQVIERAEGGRITAQLVQTVVDQWRGTDGKAPPSLWDTMHRKFLSWAEDDRVEAIQFLRSMLEKLENIR